MKNGWHTWKAHGQDEKKSMQKKVLPRRKVVEASTPLEGSPKARAKVAKERAKAKVKAKI